MRKLLTAIVLFLFVATLAVAEDKEKNTSVPKGEKKSAGVIQEPKKEENPDREASHAKSSVKLSVEYGEKKASTGQKGRVIEITVSGAKEPLKVFLIEPGSKPEERRQIALLRPEEKRNPGWKREGDSWKKSQPIKLVRGNYVVKVTDEQGHFLAQKTAD